MKKSRLRPISDKQRERNKDWMVIKSLKLSQGKRCQWCGLREGTNELWRFDLHHKDGNRRNNTYDNAYLCHRVCHSFIHDHNVDVSKYPNLNAWRAVGGQANK